MTRWEEWQRAFWRGRLGAVYLLIVLFIISLSLILTDRNTVYFYPSLVAVLSSYAVFTDCVAHLWPLFSDRSITYRQWVIKLIRGRTHDVYGMIIVMASLSVSLNHISVAYNAAIIIADFIALLEIGAFAYTRFYH